MGKKCLFPSTGFEPVPLGYAPTVLPITSRLCVCVPVCSVKRKGEWQCMCVFACLCLRVGVPACARACVCHNEKRGVPDEWQARQATQAILQVSSSKHNAKKITTRVRGPFHQSITVILTEEKREEKQFTKPTHVAVYLFRDLDRDRSRL